MTITTFDHARIALERYLPTHHQHTGQAGLQDMRQFMAYLDNPQDKLRVVHVAGTSGKTSTCYYLSGLLTMAGKRTGLTVSPHVDTISERVQINGVPLTEREFCRELETFLAIVEQSKIPLVYFQVLIGFAYWYFAKSNVDYVVVETGFGGLLDNTNVVTRPDKLCVITDIGFDHMHILGNSIPEIAAQKAGIIQQSNHAFMYSQGDVIDKVIADRSKAYGADLHIVNGSDVINGLTRELPLFQQRNWLLAYQVYEWLLQAGVVRALSSHELGEAMEVAVPARMESVQINGKIVVFDAAHNTQKMAALVAAMKAKYKNKSVACLLSVVDSPEFRERVDLRELINLSEKIIVTGFGGSEDGPKRSVDPSELAQYCRDSGAENVEVIVNPEQAMQHLLNLSQSVLLVTGSFYLMNHTRNQLTRK